MARYASRSRRRIPMRLIAAAVGAVLVVGTALLVLGPVLGLVGSAGSFGPAFTVPVGGITAAVVIGFLVAIGLVLLAAITRVRWLSWTFAILAWLVSLVASVWPIVATANAAVDRVGEIIPWITELIGSIG